MNGDTGEFVSAFTLGVTAADHLRNAYRLGRKAKGLPRGSMERANAERQRDFAIDAAVATEEAILKMQPNGPHDMAAMAVAGFMVLSRMTDHDTFEGNNEAARQAVAVKRSLANMVARAAPECMFQLCGPGVYNLLLCLTDDAQFGEEGRTLLSA